MKTSELLKAAKAKIADEKCWTQDVIARDCNKREVWSRSKEAVCFCSIGAMENVTTAQNWYGSTWHKAWRLLNEAAGKPIGLYNDTHTHAEVMAKWDEAIKLAEDDND